VVGDDDVGGLGGGDAGIQRPDIPDGQHAPMTSAAVKLGTEDGAIPAKMAENIRPTAIAGLAPPSGEL